MIVKLESIPLADLQSPVVQVVVDVGPDADHLEQAGRLTMSPAEARAFVDLCRAGSIAGREEALLLLPETEPGEAVAAGAPACVACERRLLPGPWHVPSCGRRHATGAGTGPRTGESACPACIVLVGLTTIGLPFTLPPAALEHTLAHTPDCAAGAAAPASAPPCGTCGGRGEHRLGCPDGDAGNACLRCGLQRTLSPQASRAFRDQVYALRHSATCPISDQYQRPPAPDLRPAALKRLGINCERCRRLLLADSFDVLLAIHRPHDEHCAVAAALAEIGSGAR